MNKPLTLEDAIEHLIGCAYADSRVELDRVVLEDQLRTDWEIVGRYPSAEECDELVTGGDDGEVDEEVQDLFPQTSEFIASYFE